MRRDARRTVGKPAVRHRADHGFGASFAIGDFSGDGMSDLVLGVPDCDHGADASTDGIHLICRSEFLFRDGFR